MSFCLSYVVFCTPRYVGNESERSFVQEVYGTSTGATSFISFVTCHVVSEEYGHGMIVVFHVLSSSSSMLCLHLCHSLYPKYMIYRFKKNMTY